MDVHLGVFFGGTGCFVVGPMGFLAFWRAVLGDVAAAAAFDGDFA